MVACYAESSYKVLSLVIITYGREDLEPSTLFITMLETTNLSVYHFAYLDSCQADPTACRLDEYSLIVIVSLGTELTSRYSNILPGPFPASLSSVANE